MQALRRGNKRRSFILNRVLQLAWDCCELNLHKADALAEIDRQSANMEPWMWYTVLPQLISRVQNMDMRPLFEKLIMNVLMAYPHQTGWQLVQLLRSADKERQTIGKDMLLRVGRSERESAEGKAMKNQVHSLMVMYFTVACELDKLATFSPPDNQPTMSLRASFQKLLGGAARLSLIL